MGVDLRGGVAVGVSDAGDLLSWDALTGQAILEANDGLILVGVALSPSGEQMFIGASDQSDGQILDTTTGEEVSRMACGNAGNHTNEFTAVAWSPIGDTLAATSFENSVPEYAKFCVYDGATFDSDRVFEHEDGLEEFEDVTYAPDGTTIGALSDLHLQTFDHGDGETISLSFDDLDRGRIAFRSETEFAISSIDLNGVACGDMDEGTYSGCYDTPANDIAYSPDGQYLAVATEDGDLVILSRFGYGVVAEQTAAHNQVWSVAWSEDGRSLITGGKGPRVAVWSVVYE